MNDLLFEDILIPNGLVRGPFGSDMKKSFFIKENPKAIKVLTQENVFEEDVHIGSYFITPEYFIKMKRFEVHEGDFLITCDGTLGKILYVDKLERKTIINSSLLIVRINKNIIEPKYFYYLWKQYLARVLPHRNANSCLQHLPKLDTVKRERISLPSISEQQHISEVLADIDNKIKLNFLAIKKIEKIMDVIYSKKYVDELVDGYTKSDVGMSCKISTGKYDANHEKEDGMYSFFTCAEDTKWCDTYSYDSQSVLIAGNGSLSVKAYDGKFDAYQRTYVIEPNDSRLFGIVYITCNKYIKKLRNQSNGSIVKFIKLDMVKNIPIKISKDLDIFDELNNYLCLKLKLENESHYLNKYLNFLSGNLLSGNIIIK